LETLTSGKERKKGGGKGSYMASDSRRQRGGKRKEPDPAPRAFGRNGLEEKKGEKESRVGL